MSLLYIDPLFTGSWALSISPKRVGMVGIPLRGGFFPRSGSGEMGPLPGQHKKESFTYPAQTDVFHAMFWVWCGLLLLIGASSVRVSWSDPPSVQPVTACSSVRRVCFRPWPSVRQILRPRAFTVNNSWIFDAFAACVGACRVSGVNAHDGLNFPSPLLPLTLILTIGSTYRAWTLHRPPAIPTTKTG